MRDFGAVCKSRSDNEIGDGIPKRNELRWLVPDLIASIVACDHFAEKSLGTQAFIECLYSCAHERNSIWLLHMTFDNERARRWCFWWSVEQSPFSEERVQRIGSGLINLMLSSREGVSKRCSLRKVLTSLPVVSP